MKISIDTLYQTLDGKEVRVYAIDGCTWPIHGAVKTSSGWHVQSWSYNGENSTNRRDWDIIEKPERYELDTWMAIGIPGKSSTYVSTSKQGAIDAFQYHEDKAPFACIHIKRTVTKGEGL